MVQKEPLNLIEIENILAEICRQKPPVIGSFMFDGKWRVFELRANSLTDDSIIFSIETPCENFQKEMPVGICAHLGHFKYLFDSTVQAIEQRNLSQRILLNFPDKVERVERRAYHRHSVPADMTVKVMFWHRGYLDDLDEAPAENYWQGRLLNLSAGGARFEIEIEQKEHFKVGQILGIQFTPMSYQKPLLLESHVKYAEEQSDNKHFRIGVEFLGLESSPEDREILNRILETINQYEAMHVGANASPSS
ncbi:MAG: PilZ domain-containing protein [Planctomycetota bacterium]